MRLPRQIGHYTLLRTEKYADTVLFSAVRQEVQEYLRSPAGLREIRSAARAEAKDFIQEAFEIRDLPFHLVTRTPEGTAQ
jgi:hypothetical protein